MQPAGGRSACERLGRNDLQIVARCVIAGPPLPDQIGAKMETTFMKPINKDELYQNLSEFLKTKGVSLQNGSYSRGIQAGCSFLADAINLSQAGLTRAKNEIEKQLDHARQIIHDK